MHHYNVIILVCQVLWVRLYRKGTSMEGGTLLQLKNLLNRTHLPRDPHKNVNATEDFVNVIFTGHVIAAAMKYFNMNAIGDIPDKSLIPSNIESLSQEEKKAILFSNIETLLHSVVNLTLPGEHHTNNAEVDGVREYAKEVLTLTLLYKEYDDAIKEGDGQRVLQVWRFLLFIFKAGNRKNYAIEALTLLSQYHFFLSPRLAQQLLHSRFINTHGWPGHNIPCDLHMEHINRACKTAVNNLVANLTPKAIVRVGRCVGSVMNITQQFDRECDVSPTYGTHADVSLKKDVKCVVKELVEKSKVFSNIPGRYHTSFKSLTGSITEKLELDELTQWMGRTIKRMHQS